MTTEIETKWIGPFLFKSMQSFSDVEKDVKVSAPLATYETTLFYSVARGARAISLSGGLNSTIIKDSMSRSVTVECIDAIRALQLSEYLKNNIPLLQVKVVQLHSKYAKLEKIDTYAVANLLYIRFSFYTSNASGHNMVTLMSDYLLDYVFDNFKDVRYVSLSGNMCVDKKVSMINAIEGRGKHIISEIIIPKDIVEKVLKSTPEAIVNLNIKKNLLGSIMSGSIHSANAHYANMLLAFYLATGQDGANIVEGSQGITHAEVRDGNLYFSVSIPNIIVGTVGHGKGSSHIQEHLKAMDCLGEKGSVRLAHICAAVVFAGELSLLAALTNQHELMKAHVSIERK